MSGDVLLVNIGNSQTKTAWWGVGADLRPGKQWPTHQKEELLSTLSKDLKAVVLASVVPDIDDSFMRVARGTGVPVIPVTPEAVAAARLITGTYESIGADRLVNLIALSRMEPLPALCVDAGTAITFELMDSEKRFAGGLIAPGPRLMASALSHGTALLPEIEPCAGGILLGQDTPSSIASGCWWGSIALVEGILEILKRNGKTWRLLVLTGGFASVLSTFLTVSHHVEPDLSFKGLIHVWKAYEAGDYPG